MFLLRFPTKFLERSFVVRKNKGDKNVFECVGKEDFEKAGMKLSAGISKIIFAIRISGRAFPMNSTLSNQIHFSIVVSLAFFLEHVYEQKNKFISCPDLELESYQLFLQLTKVIIPLTKNLINKNR